MCDILKISDDELCFFYDGQSVIECTERLRKDFPHISIIFLTKGKNGSEGFIADIHATAPAFCGMKTIDTTGAGDTFFGCCLARILELGKRPPDEKWLIETLRFAAAAAALITTKNGALGVMPNRSEIDALIASCDK
jgi:fructokinase